jgi:putative endonuclease
MRQGYVYLLTNKPNGILYTGVTGDLSRRIYEHKQKLFEGFTKKYGLDTLVYYEVYDSITEAIAREKTIKAWKRAWKVRLILQSNPEWADLYETLN